jgi:hypothetical protein
MYFGVRTLLPDEQKKSLLAKWNTERQNFYQLLSISCFTVTHSRDTEGMSKCLHAQMCTEKILIFRDNRSEIFLNFSKFFIVCQDHHCHREGKRCKLEIIVHQRCYELIQGVRKTQPQFAFTQMKAEVF